MPYIKEERRTAIGSDGWEDPANAGELNFALTQICNHYINHRGSSYQQMNDVLGALEGCKLELYRRVIAPYEDVKMEINGDVY